MRKRVKSPQKRLRIQAMLIRQEASLLRKEKKKELRKSRKPPINDLSYAALHKAFLLGQIMERFLVEAIRLEMIAKNKEIKDIDKLRAAKEAENARLSWIAFPGEI